MYPQVASLPNIITYQLTQKQHLLTVLLSIIALTTALPSPNTHPIQTRACAYTCSTHCYTKSAVTAAQQAGYKLHSSNSDVSDYPHQYHNYEDFDFPVPGEYFEFPILASGDTYDGGSPGADRVIFNADDKLAGVITHSGADEGDFVACTG